jgi:uncharacterized protein (DUF302 family)
MRISIHEVRVQRVKVTTTTSFDKVVARVAAAIGHPDMAAFHESLSAAQNLNEMEAVVDPATQPNGLMEFARFDLGEILRKDNPSSRLRVLRLVVGNPLIMKAMVKHVVDAGSYAPVTILIHESANGVSLSYDRIVSYLASYGNEDALTVARELDAKVEKILTSAAK